MEAEVREDEEQQLKYQEIIHLLVAAGYFRARIKGLEPFDKVVGGITWCIQSCSVDLDVELLFRESLTIGQKIALTEKIIAVLPKMKCSHRLEPHQIQGLDFIHIFPVVQWLVKKGLETRKEMADYIRSYSVSQYKKQFGDLSDLITVPSKNNVEAIYHPRRFYRRTGSLDKSSIEERVKSTLMEYGHLVSSHSEQDAQHEESTQHEDEEVPSLQKMMRATGENEGRLTASRVGCLVGLQADEIREAAARYVEEARTADQSSDMTSAQHYHKLTEHLEKQLLLVNNECQVLRRELSSKVEEKARLEQEAGEVKSQRETLDEFGAQLKSQETDENKPILENLRRLVEENEKLKQEEAKFKESCRREKASKQKTIEEMKIKLEGGDEVSDEILKQHEACKKKLERMRQIMSRKNRAIAQLERKVDSVPSRAELQQYQKRFLELFNQMATKHKETKQYYTMYNTLCDTKLYLEKELSLLNSILDNFQEAMSSNAGREEFLSQFDGILEVVRNNKLKMESYKALERVRRDELSDKYLELMEQHRRYHHTLTELQIECRKNEHLQQRTSYNTRL